MADLDIKYTDDAAACVVLASGGYPEDYEKGKLISGLEDVDDSIVVFHSGTKFDGDKIVTNGGRVLGVCSRALPPFVTICISIWRLSRGL